MRKQPRLPGYTFLGWGNGFSRWIKFKVKNDPSQVESFLKLDREAFFNLKNEMWKAYNEKKGAGQVGT